MKPDLLVIFGPSPYPPDVVMDRLLDVVEAAGGRLGHWYGEVVLDAYETGSDTFSVVRETDSLESRDDLRARIRRNGSGQASYWSGKMLSGSEDALVAGPVPELRPRHIAWRRDAFEPSQLGVWGMFTPGMIERGVAFDHVELW